MKSVWFAPHSRVPPRGLGYLAHKGQKIPLESVPRRKFSPFHWKKVLKVPSPPSAGLVKSIHWLGSIFQTSKLSSDTVCLDTGLASMGGYVLTCYWLKGKGNRSGQTSPETGFGKVNVCVSISLDAD